jgi:hypothetical protein
MNESKNQFFLPDRVPLQNAAVKKQLWLASSKVTVPHHPHYSPEFVPAIILSSLN